MHAYARLGPDAILDALESAGWLGDGRLLALNSYENRVYQVWLEDGQCVVVKFYRPERWTDAQILEEHAWTQTLFDQGLPVVAPIRQQGQTLHEHAGWRFAVTPRRGGRAPELDDPSTLERLGLMLGRMHALGGQPTFRERPAVDIASLGLEPRDWLMSHGALPPALRPAWEAAVQGCLQAVQIAFERVQGQIRTIRLHGDCHAGNVLWTDEGPHFVDFDDARNGPAIQDLWMLLSGAPEEMQIQLASLLRGYRRAGRFDPRELALIEPLRTLRLIHYSAWIGRRWEDPAFPAAFPWFGTDRYWQDRILELREQLGALSEPPLPMPLD
jgi:Ser/Thr protein kinase RdoA (MazF antagonist)